MKFPMIQQFQNFVRFQQQTRPWLDFGMVEEHNYITHLDSLSPKPEDIISPTSNNYFLPRSVSISPVSPEENDSSPEPSPASHKSQKSHHSSLHSHKSKHSHRERSPLNRDIYDQLVAKSPYSNQNQSRPGSPFVPSPKERSNSPVIWVNPNSPNGPSPKDQDRQDQQNSRMYQIRRENLNRADRDLSMLSLSRNTSPKVGATPKTNIEKILAGENISEKVSPKHNFFEKMRQLPLKPNLPFNTTSKAKKWNSNKNSPARARSVGSNKSNNRSRSVSPSRRSRSASRTPGILERNRTLNNNRFDFSNSPKDTRQQPLAHNTNAYVFSPGSMSKNLSTRKPMILSPLPIISERQNHIEAASLSAQKGVNLQDGIVPEGLGGPSRSDILTDKITNSLKGKFTHNPPPIVLFHQKDILVLDFTDLI